MHLTKLYGQRSVVFHDGKQNYCVKNGVVELPAHLVQRAIDQGFSRTPYADLSIPDDRPAIDAPDAPVTSIEANAPTTSTTPETDQQPATQKSALPPAHPQVAATAALATREQLRAAEQRIRDGGK